MRKRSDIRAFEDEDFLRRTARLSMTVLVTGVAATLLFGLALACLAPEFLDARLIGVLAADGSGIFDCLAWMGWVVVAVTASLAAHELVHALFFKAFAPCGARVTFGANWKRGMLYACAGDIVYTRRQYLAIALAPSLVVTPLVFAVGLAAGSPVAGAFAAVLHLSGCTGDWSYVHEIRIDPAISYCEDTDYGVCFYEEDGPSEVGSVAPGGALASAPGASAFNEARAGEEPGR